MLGIFCVLLLFWTNGFLIERRKKELALYSVLGIAFLGAGYGIAFLAKSPAAALMLFLVAAIFVVIGTFCLFTSGSIGFLKALRRRKNYYYTPKHFISVSSMIYRMKQNATGLAAICILSCMVLVTLGSTVGLHIGMKETLGEISFDYGAYGWSEVAQTDIDNLQAYVQQSAAEHGLTVTDEKRYNTVSFWAYDAPQGGLILNGESDDSYRISFVTKAEAQQAEGVAFDLPQGGVAVYSNIAFAVDSLVINGVSVPATKAPVKMYPVSHTSIGVPVIVVVAENEAAIDDLMAQIFPDEPWYRRFNEYSFCLAEPNDPAAVDSFDAALTSYGTDIAGHLVEINQFEQVEDEFETMNGGFLFLGVFFSVLFLMATTLIIYYKQISEGYEDADRFAILQKVGMSEAEVRKSIFSQVRTVFFLPLGVAMVHVAVAFIPVHRALRIMGVFSPWPVALAFAAALLVYALVYLVVFRRTASTYFRIVRRTV